MPKRQVSIFNEADLTNPRDDKEIKEVKTSADVQRLKVERLMAKPEKLAHIPDRPREWAPRAPPEFIRNVWGSSAGVGSGDFHIYRGIRRREYARQKYNEEKMEKEEADRTYLQRVQGKEEKAAIKREKKKRQKEKLLAKKKKMTAAATKEGQGDKPAEDKNDSSSSSEESEVDEGVAELIGDLDDIDPELLAALGG